MSVLFANPGAAALTITHVSLQIFSFLVMGVVLLAFRSVYHKQRALYTSLRDYPRVFPKYVVILWTYGILTVVIAVVSLGLFFFQPHLL